MSYFQKGDVVQSKATAQGMAEYGFYTVLSVDEMVTPFGRFCTYWLVGTDGRQLAVNNLHLLAEKQVHPTATATVTRKRRAANGAGKAQQVRAPRKPAFAPTALNDHWRNVVDHVLSHLDCLVALDGDDTRDEQAALHGVRSEWLAKSAQGVLGTIWFLAKNDGDLRAAVSRTTPVVRAPETLDWIVYVINDVIDQGQTDEVDADDLRVLRQIAKYLAAR